MAVAVAVAGALVVPRAMPLVEGDLPEVVAGVVAVVPFTGRTMCTMRGHQR